MKPIGQRVACLVVCGGRFGTRSFYLALDSLGFHLDLLALAALTRGQGALVFWLRRAREALGGCPSIQLQRHFSARLSLAGQPS